MKRIVFLLFIVIFTSIFAQAQDQDALKKIESARIALITDRLDLSPDQAEKFWPIYREYSEKRRNARMELLNARKNVDTENMSDEEGQQLMEMSLKTKEKMLALEKEYSKKMLEIISSQQIVALKEAETDFNKMLLQRIEQRQQNQQRRDLMRERRQEYLQQRNSN